MNRTTIALAVVAGVALSAPAAQACIDDEPCPSRIPFTRYIPKALPDLPDIPKGVPRAAIPKVPPKATERNIENKAASDEIARPAPKAAATDSEVRVVEKPSYVRTPEPARVCTKYLPSLGKSVEIPCD